MKGQRLVDSIFSTERGQLVTIIACISATGYFLPPTLIFLQKKVNPAYKYDLSPDTQCFVSDSGWINGTIFLARFKFFVNTVPLLKSTKCFLYFIIMSFIALCMLSSISDIIMWKYYLSSHTINKLRP